MKIVHEEILIDAGTFSQSLEWNAIHREITDAIATIRWPVGSPNFTLHTEKHGNGVSAIKTACMEHLKTKDWKLERSIDIATLKKPGPMDASCIVGSQLFCLEWETGNISSTHRAINKMALGMLKEIFVGGVLVLPSRAMYRYLTDRIGNYEEIEPYFDLWKSLSIKNGILMVIAIEHDALDMAVPKIRDSGHCDEQNPSHVRRPDRVYCPGLARSV